MKLKLDTTFQNLNTRNQLEGDDVTPRIDMKFCADVDADVLGQFFEFGNQFSKLRDAIWDENGTLQVIGLGNIQTQYEYDPIKITLASDAPQPIVLLGMKLNKISFTVSNNHRARVFFRVQGSPAEGNLDRILRWETLPIEIEVESMQADLLEEEAA